MYRELRDLFARHRPDRARGPSRRAHGRRQALLRRQRPRRLRHDGRRQRARAHVPRPGGLLRHPGVRRARCRRRRGRRPGNWAVSRRCPATSWWPRDDASFGLPELSVGVHGGARHLGRMVSQPVVRWMFFTGQRLSATEMQSLGAAHRRGPERRAATAGQECEAAGRGLTARPRCAWASRGSTRSSSSTCVGATSRSRA